MATKWTRTATAQRGLKQNCGFCSATIDEKTQAMTCDSCNKCICLKCSKISTPLYQELLKSDANSLSWNCSTCESEHVSLKTINKNILELSKSNDKRFTSIESLLSNLLSTLKQLVKREVDAVKDDMSQAIQNNIAETKTEIKNRGAIPKNTASAATHKRVDDDTEGKEGSDEQDNAMAASVKAEGVAENRDQVKKDLRATKRVDDDIEDEEGSDEQDNDSATNVKTVGVAEKGDQEQLFDLRGPGKVKYGTEIYKFMKNQLDIWFKDNQCAVYIVTPFIDEARLADICIIYLDNRKTANLGGVFLRSQWDRNTVQKIKSNTEKYLKQELNISKTDIEFIKQIIYPNIFAVSTRTRRFHAKFIATVREHEENADVLYTSANFTKHHFECNNLETVKFETMSKKDFMDGIHSKICMRISCLRCKKICNSDTQLKNHLKSSHSASTLICLWCTQKRSDMEKLETHFYKQHSEHPRPLKRDPFFSVTNAFYYALEPDAYAQYCLKELPQDDSETKQLRLKDLESKPDKKKELENKWAAGREWIKSNC